MSYDRASDLYSLLVLNVTFRTRASELTPLFQKYGEVRDCYIPRSRDSGDSRGFAFVRYSKREEAEAAIEHVNGAVVDGREIIVQFAKFGRQDAVNQAAALGVPAAEVDVAGAAPRTDPVDGDASAVPMRDSAAPDARDDVVESRKRQLNVCGAFWMCPRFAAAVVVHVVLLSVPVGTCGHAPVVLPSHIGRYGYTAGTGVVVERNGCPIS
ncbi:hypothetical protein I4F81_000849 [Pyropia yezoensis]|uniref:Uncharacterized protein n=1 Tax=Pyropia yezoensis TaxID=2788 RepID=A0ACC3BKT5_PYRYE|nr:hypothetical protein I4F81_000849 [Neopyropia yezoensis]